MAITHCPGEGRFHLGGETINRIDCASNVWQPNSEKIRFLGVGRIESDGEIHRQRISKVVEMQTMRLESNIPVCSPREKGTYNRR